LAKARERRTSTLIEHKNESGQSLVEFSLVIGIFAVLVMGLADFGLLFYTQVTLQNAVRQAGRYAITGQCLGGAGSCTSTRLASIQQALEAASVGLINGSNIGADVVIACQNEGGGCPNQAGGPGDVITITVTYPYSFILPIGVVLPNGFSINVSAAFTNEPFPPSQS